METRELDHWVSAQETLSKNFLRQSISATHLSHARPGFSQTVFPARGSVLASPVSALWNPEPDYFYHWVRDSAIVMNCIVEIARAEKDVAARDEWCGYIEDYVAFSLDCNRKAAGVTQNPLIPGTAADLQKYLRSAESLSAVNENTVLMEPRFNPDGTVDCFRWARPQYDGPALRALFSINYLKFCAEVKRDEPEGIRTLLDGDLSFTVEHADKPCVGPWEEPNDIDQHYFTSLVQLGALHHGAAYMMDKDRAEAIQAADMIRRNLDLHLDAQDGSYKSMRHLPSSFDASQFMAAVHADLPFGRHSLTDDHLLNTVRKMENYFSKEYAVNHGQRAPVIGRSAEDAYFGNNPWYPTSLSLAEFYYKRAALLPQRSAVEFQKGDALMMHLRANIPEDGALSEQFDRAGGGKPVSARHLTWSYAAFAMAAKARREPLPHTR